MVRETAGECNFFSSGMGTVRGWTDRPSSPDQGCQLGCAESILRCATLVTGFCAEPSAFITQMFTTELVLGVSLPSRGRAEVFLSCKVQQVRRWRGIRRAKELRYRLETLEECA